MRTRRFFVTFQNIIEMNNSVARNNEQWANLHLFDGHALVANVVIRLRKINIQVENVIIWKRIA